MYTVVGYIRQYLNNSASPSPTASVEALTNTPIGTGLNVGAWQEFSDGQAASYSSKQLSSAQILTAGSGQTNGTYTATASSGGAQIQYTVAGGAVTAVTVLSGGTYTTDVAPTFTIAAGGTPGTVSATLGFLYDGAYAWCQLDSAVVGAIAVGQPLYWLAGQNSFVVTTVATGNFPDFAGFSVDPGFGAVNGNGQRNLYAFVQMTGKAKALFNATQPAAIGDVVNLAGTPGAAVTAVVAASPNGAVTNLTVGFALAIGTTLTPSLIRVTRAQSRF